jgi:hypothetical protein
MSHHGGAFPVDRIMGAVTCGGDDVAVALSTS